MKTQNQPPKNITPFKLYSETQLDILLKALSPIVDTWTTNWLGTQDFTNVIVENAYEQAQHIERFFQDDMWLRSFKYSFLNGHAWILTDDGSLNHYAQQMLASCFPSELGCKATKEIYMAGFADLIHKTSDQHVTSLLKYKQLSPHMTQSGTGWIGLEIHFSHASMTVLLSPTLITAHLPQTTILTGNEDMQARDVAIANVPLRLKPTIELPPMPIPKLTQITVGETLWLDSCSPKVKLFDCKQRVITQGDLLSNTSHFEVKIHTGV